MPEGESERPHVEDLEELSGSEFEILVKKIYNDPSLIETVAPSQHRRLVEVMIQDGGGYFVARHPDLFSGFDHAELARLLIKKGEGSIVAEHLNKFTGLDHNEIARLLIEKGESAAVALNLDKFSDLDADIAPLLIEKGKGYAVSINLDKFSGLDHNEIAHLLIRKGDDFADVALNLDKFSGLDHNEIAHLLIEEGRGQSVVRNLNNFTGIDHNEIVRLLIGKGESVTVASHLAGFSGLDADIAPLLIEKGQGYAVAANLDKFSGLDHNEIVHLLMRKVRGGVDVANNLDKFSGLDHNEIAHLIMGSGDGFAISKNIEKFSGLDADVACRLIEMGDGEVVVNHLEKFFGLNYSDIARLLIERQEIFSVINHLDKFSGLDADVAVLLMAYFGLKDVLANPERFNFENATPEQLQIFSFFNDESIPRKIRESKEVSSYLQAHLERSVDYVANLDPAALCARMTVGVPPSVYARTKYFDVQPESAPPDKLIFEWEYDYRRRDGDENILEQFGNGKRVFGARVMLDYLRAVDVSEHDALQFMPDIIALQDKSGLTAEQFGRNILAQVGRDGASYEEGSAHHRFAAVCQELVQTDVEAAFEEARKYTKVKKLQELLDDFGREHFASSWKTLKKTYELVQLLKRTEIIEELDSGELDPKLRTYVERLAFHPNISTEAVIRFWKDPARFLEIEDEHTDQRINEVKKPSNYLSLPFLGLRAEDLRDAYVSGELDSLQTLPPMERTYVLGVPALRPETVHGDVRRALGQERKGIKGEGRNPKKIFDELRKFCSQYKCHLPDLLDPEKGIVIVRELPSEAVTRLHEIAFDPKIGMKALKSGETYRIRIGLKSDPEMAVAGNDTASCMPFGAGKNNVYMFNPNCTQLVLERQLEDGSWRTAAQSVMTIDHVASKPTPELIKAYQETGGHLGELISEEDLVRTPIVTCDNIEVAKNEEGNRRERIHEAYEKFFKEYLSAYANVLGVDATRVAVGQGYTPENLGFKEVPNTFVPQAPMGYSDNVHETAYLIETGLKPLEAKPRQGMAPLSTRDALAVAMLEGKAYKDNESLLMNLHHMQNAIIGMEIANAHFKRPNLSSMYRDAKGLPRGYMLAYEGVNGGLPEVYIDDLASDRTNRMAGGRLINQFFESYLKNYGTEERPFIPIFTNARESTSYPIIKANVERLAERAGLVAEMVEVGTHQRGQDTFHDVRIHIARTPEELEAQKAEYAGTAAAADASDEDW